jgi:hypothetical protein
MCDDSKCENALIGDLCCVGFINPVGVFPGVQPMPEDITGLPYF